MLSNKDAPPIDQGDSDHIQDHIGNPSDPTPLEELQGECFTEDLEYQVNAGTSDGTPLQLSGREAFANFWRPLVRQINVQTTPGQLFLAGDVGRVQVRMRLKHRMTGFVYNGSYRQIFTFRAGLICRIEEYHDVAKLNAFWGIVAEETARAENS